MNDLEPILLGTTNLTLYPSIIDKAKVIGKDDLEDVLRLAKPLIENVGNEGHAKALILQAINDIPKDDRKELLEGITHYLKGMKGADILQLLQYIKKLDNDERMQIVLCSIPHIDGTLSQENRLLTLEALSAVGREQRGTIQTADVKSRIQVMHLVKNIFEKFSSKEDQEELMKQLQRVPHTERNSLLSTVAPLVDKIETPAQLGELMYGLFLVAPDYRQSVLTSLKGGSENQNFSWQAVIQHAFTQMPNNTALRDATHQHLEKMLTPIIEQEPAYQLSTLIWNNRERFGLMEEMPLAQLAMRIMIISNPDMAGDAKSAFNVYKKHVLDEKTPTPSISIPKHTIAGVSVRLNQKVLEDRAKAEVKITFGELPKTVTSQTVEELFGALASRVQNLDATLKAEITQYVDGSTGSSITNLRQNFTNDLYINSLLSTTGQSTDPAPKDIQRFYSILNYIKSLSNAIADGELLSPREDALLKISASIQNCSSGKSEGIAMAYNLLPSKFKLGSVESAVELPSKQKALNYLDSIIQAFLLTQLSENNALMKALVGTQYINQVAHQAQYIKNQIAWRVGLKHEIKFDHYTGCISQNLFNRPLKKLLEIAFQHITPKQFVEEFIKFRRREMLPKIAKVLADQKAEELKDDAVLTEQLSCVNMAFEISEDVKLTIKKFKEEIEKEFDNEAGPKPDLKGKTPNQAALARMQRQKALRPLRIKRNQRLDRLYKEVANQYVDSLPGEKNPLRLYLLKKAVFDAVKFKESIEDAVKETDEALKNPSKLVLAQLIVQAGKEHFKDSEMDKKDKFDGYFTELLSGAASSDLWDIDEDLELQMITEKGAVEAFIQAGYFERA